MNNTSVLARYGAMQRNKGKNSQSFGWSLGKMNRLSEENQNHLIDQVIVRNLC